MKTQCKCQSGGQRVSEIKPYLAGLLKRYNEDWRQVSGFTFIEMVIVVTIIGLLAAIAVPKAIQARDKAQTHTCVENLLHLDESKQQWATEYRKAETAVPTTDDIAPYFRANMMPFCPAKGHYTIGSVEDPSLCSLYARGHIVNPDDAPSGTTP